MIRTRPDWAISGEIAVSSAPKRTARRLRGCGGSSSHRRPQTRPAGFLPDFLPLLLGVLFYRVRRRPASLAVSMASIALQISPPFRAGIQDGEPWTHGVILYRKGRPLSNHRLGPIRVPSDHELLFAERSRTFADRTIYLVCGDLGLTYWRRGGESNPRIKVLQTSALPLGYRASPIHRGHFHRYHI